MLRKMYLVSADHYHEDKFRHPLSSSRQRKKLSRGTRFKKQNTICMKIWLRFVISFVRPIIRGKTQAKLISDILRRVIPDTATPTSNRAPSYSSEQQLAKDLIVPKVEAKTFPQKKRKKSRPPSTIPSTSKEIACETPKQSESYMVMMMMSRSRRQRRKMKMSGLKLIRSGGRGVLPIHSTVSVRMASN